MTGKKMERGNTTREAREFLTWVELQTEGLRTTSELFMVPAAKRGHVAFIECKTRRVHDYSAITFWLENLDLNSTEEEESGRGSFVFGRAWLHLSRRRRSQTERSTLSGYFY